MEYRVISADNHVIEPPGTYVDRVPSALKDRAPRVLPGADGGEGWSLHPNFVGIKKVETDLQHLEDRAPEAGDYARPPYMAPDDAEERLTRALPLLNEVVPAMQTGAEIGVAA